MKFRVITLPVLIAAAHAAAMSVTITPSVAPPMPIEKAVTRTAVAADVGSGTVWYRFRVHPPGGDFHVVKDFGPDNSLDWTSIRREGGYQMEVAARSIGTGNTAPDRQEQHRRTPVPMRR
jgi:hypothetical protein